jgi:hypothetical protein
MSCLSVGQLPSPGPTSLIEGCPVTEEAVDVTLSSG